MRKSIYSSNEIFTACYSKISTLIEGGIKVDELPAKLESEYLPKEIKLFVDDLGLVKSFKKVDNIQILYRILAVIVLLLFIMNFLFVVVFASIAKENPSVKVDFAFFSLPILFSLIGIFISILQVINSFWESPTFSNIILISFFFFSQVYRETFIIFKSTSAFYWLPVIIFVSTFLLTIRLVFPTRERMLRLLKKLRQNGIEISSIHEELSTNIQNQNKTSILKFYEQKPNSKEFFYNLPYKVKKNPTEVELITWVKKKRRNNNIFLALLTIFICAYGVLFAFTPADEINVYEIIQLLLGIVFWIYLFLKRKSIKRIDENYINTALAEMKSISR